MFFYSERFSVLCHPSKNFQSTFQQEHTTHKGVPFILQCKLSKLIYQSANSITNCRFPVKRQNSLLVSFSILEQICQFPLPTFRFYHWLQKWNSLDINTLPDYRSRQEDHLWAMTTVIKKRHCAFRMTHCISWLQGAIQNWTSQLQTDLQITKAMNIGFE